MNIVGNKVLLRAVEFEDSNQLHIWANDPEIQYLLGGWHFPTNMNDQKKWFDNLSCNSNNQRFIVLNEDKIKIGMANLLNINFKDGNAEHGLLLDKNFQGKGYGTEIVKAIMNYAFKELRLNRLETTIIESNIVSAGLFVKLGWKHEGTLRNWYFRKGEFVNKLIFGVLNNEFLNND